MSEKSNFPMADKVIAPQGKRLPIVLEHCKGLFRRFLVNGKGKKDYVDARMVQEFFRDRSNENKFSDFADSDTSWYLEGLDQSRTLRSALQNPMRLRILDAGCGRGGLLRWLNARRTSEFEYVGVDFDEIAMERCRKRFSDLTATFLVEDMTSPSLKFVRPFDLVFVVNLLPYIRDARAVLRVLASRCNTSAGLLFLIEPVPSKFWETKFGGFRVAFRQEASLQRLTTELGLNVLEHIILYTCSIFGLPCLPLNRTLVCRIDNYKQRPYPVKAG